MTTEVHHLLVPGDEWRRVPDLAATVPPTDELVVATDGAATCALLGALAPQLTRRVGVWLVVHDGYRAALAARDVATLSWLMDLSTVVLSSADDFVTEHARVFAALLSDAEVSVTTSVAFVTGAYNRPAPRAPIQVACATTGPDSDPVVLTPLAARAGVAPWDAAHTSRRLRVA